MTANATPYVIQALSHPADNFRRALSFDALGQQGVRSWVVGDLLVTQNGSPNMSVNVAAGQCLINGTQNTTSQGSYHGLNDATVNLAIAASDPTNPRIDIVVAQVEDAVYSGANNDFKLAVVTGTPAPSPSPPATPANAIVLAQVAVAANATSITSGNITDKRPIFGSLFHAEVYQTNAQTYGTGATPSVIAYDTILSDPSGSISGLGLTSFKYTAPVSGRYLVSAGLVWAATLAKTSSLSVFVNAANAAQGMQSDGTNGTFAIAMAAQVRATNGQSIDVRAAEQSGVNIATNPGQANVYAQFSYQGPL